MIEKEQLKTMWELFVNGAILHPNLDPLVKSSWLRSRRNQVDPFQRIGEKKCSEQQLRLLLKQKKELIALAMPLMETLYLLVKGTGFLVVLCDEHGHLLKVIGDPEPLKRAEKIQFVSGANWSEEVIGTNAIGTAIVERQPMQIFSYQHFMQATQAWTCSASPIYDASGQMIGVLNISGPYEKVHPHTLGMIVATVKAIEYELQLKEKTEKNQQMMSYLEETTNTLSDGMIILNEQGRIIKTNRIVQQLLHVSAIEIEGKPITMMIESLEIADYLATNQEISDREVKLSVSKTDQQLSVLLNAKPILREDHVIGSLITVKEIKRVRQLVNHFSGNQAKVTFSDIIGNNEQFLACMAEAKFAAQTDATVLLMGGSGTGKDLFAQAIHNESGRRTGPFIPINCGGIPRDLLGSELFGYVEGAFTGARKGGSAGKFELADGGTLFLDEIGEMSLEMQVLLLRVLQNHEIIRIGGAKIVPVNVRIIAATNKNLKKEVQKGNFREDLYFRLNVMPIQIPNLRERKDDIPLLATYFVSQLASRLHKPQPKISSDVLQLLTNYSWPGNVRELHNILERALVRSTQNELSVNLLPSELREENYLTEEHALFLPVKEERKKQALIESINKYDGNFSKAAAYLGVSRSTLYRQMKRYNLH